MKVLFLDVDGVLNLFPNPARNGVFNKTQCVNLQMLLNKVPDLKIVVSSSWRTFGLEAMRDILKSNGIDPRRVLDVTGHEKSPDNKDHRGFQVYNWLKKHPNVKSFAIVDDENDFGSLRTHLLRTNRYLGLTQANVEKLMEMLDHE